MRRFTAALWVMAALLTGCDKETPRPLTEQEKQQRIDSMTEIRLQEAEAHARKELEYRMKIEVKVKADSINQARNQPAQANSNTSGIKK